MKGVSGLRGEERDASFPRRVWSSSLDREGKRRADLMKVGGGRGKGRTEDKRMVAVAVGRSTKALERKRKGGRSSLNIISPITEKERKGKGWRYKESRRRGRSLPSFLISPQGTREKEMRRRGEGSGIGKKEGGDKGGGTAEELYRATGTGTREEVMRS